MSERSVKKWLALLLLLCMQGCYLAQCRTVTVTVTGASCH